MSTVLLLEAVKNFLFSFGPHGILIAFKIDIVLGFDRLVLRIFSHLDKGLFSPVIDLFIFVPSWIDFKTLLCWVTETAMVVIEHLNESKRNVLNVSCSAIHLHRLRNLVLCVLLWPGN